MSIFHRAILIISLGMFSLSVQGETVYKRYDAAGNVEFSDQPTQDSEAVKLEPLPTYTPPPMPSIAPPVTNSAPPEVTYTVAITQPENHHTFSTAVQEVNVSLSVDPALTPSDAIRVILNGQPFGELTQSTSVSLGRLDRGAYTLSAQIVAKDDVNTIKATSDPITFYQQRASILAP